MDSSSSNSPNGFSFLALLFIGFFSVSIPLVASHELDELSIVDFDLYGYDYSPPSPPLPPPSPPHHPSVSCVDDLKGIGSLNETCQLNTSLMLEGDLYIEGEGSLEILPGIEVSCSMPGCMLTVNVSGEFSLDENATVVMGAFIVEADNVTLSNGSLINTTALAGAPPAQTSGTPSGTDGAGGGHGGRGACCLKDKKKRPEDVWGGDAYSWSSLQTPWTYGSKGGTTSKEGDFGGGGGGRVQLDARNGEVQVNGMVLADGGDAGLKGGGGSGGSIYIKAHKMTGKSKISAAGGNGLGGGGGGRIAVDVFSRHDDTEFFVHGGKSLGCPENNGAAGTFFENVPRSLVVSNNNMSTQTDTLLFEFPNQPLWTNVFVKNCAKVVVPLVWSRVQVRGQLSLLSGGVLSFGLYRFPLSEFELMAEELLMSDSTIKVYGALRMSVKMLLMWNSQMLIDGGADTIVATSLLEASNLVVLRGSSVIHSNSNLGVHGQGLLNLSGRGDLIEAQRLVLSLFYSINLGPGSILGGPVENVTADDLTPDLYCERQDCPMELFHPPEDCNVNSSLSFTLQICRVEDISVAGIIKGTVVHFHRARTVVIQSSGAISASGLGIISDLFS